MKKVLVILFVLLTPSVFSQQTTFSKIYFDSLSNFSSNAMAETFDGGLIVCGEFQEIPTLMRIDSLGNVQWVKQFGSQGFFKHAFNSIVKTTDSCFVIAGIDSSNGTDNFLLKIDQEGNVRWTKIMVKSFHQVIYSIINTSDGGFIMAGNQSSTPLPTSKAMVIKTDSSGDVQWMKLYYFGTQGNYAYSIKEVPGNGYVFTGHTENFASSMPSGYTCKISDSGSVEWRYSMGFGISLDHTNGNDIICLDDGIIAYYSSGRSGQSNILIKTDYLGNLIWQKAIENIAPVTYCDICVSPKMRLTSDGNICLVTGSQYDALQTVVVKIDTAGSLLWAQTLMNNVHDVMEAKDHGLYFLGNGPLIFLRTSSLTNTHVGIIKTDSLGNANDCSIPNLSVNTIPGILVPNLISVNESLDNATSTLFLPVITDLTIAERNGCVDAVPGIEEVNPGAITVYPNPATNKVNIKLDHFNRQFKLSIYDLVGTLVFEKEYGVDQSNEIQIDHNFIAGVYTVVINAVHMNLSGKFFVTN